MNANVLRAAPSAANLRWLWLSLAVIVVDQVTKHWILAVFRPGEDLPLAPFASLVLAFNSSSMLGCVKNGFRNETEEQSDDRKPHLRWNVRHR